MFNKLALVHYLLLTIIFGNYFYISDSNSKDKNGNVFNFGTAVLLKFDKLH